MKLLLFTGFVVLALVFTGCSTQPQSDIYTPADADSNVQTTTAQSSDDVIIEETQQQLANDDDFVELGEMI